MNPGASGTTSDVNAQVCEPQLLIAWPPIAICRLATNAVKPGAIVTRPCTCQNWSTTMWLAPQGDPFRALLRQIGPTAPCQALLEAGPQRPMPGFARLAGPHLRRAPCNSP